MATGATATQTVGPSEYGSQAQLVYRGRNILLETISNGDLIMAGADIIDVDATGALSLNSSGGAINIGNDAVAQPVNVGTGAAARTVTVGNVTGATAVVVNAGTGGIALTSTGAGDIVLDSDDTLLLDADGVLELNSSAGAISVGNDAVAQAVNVGTGAAARTITVGKGTCSKQIDFCK